jgi:Tfp pilus assembly protein PilX
MIPSSMMTKHSSRGTVLVVTLLFLAIISMFAISSFTSSTTNLRVAGNMVAQQEATAAAQSVIESTISATTFTKDPIAVAAAPYDVDVDGNGLNDYQVRLNPAPSCQKSRIIKTLELDPADSEDKACITSGVVVNSGIEDPSMAGGAGDSLCASTEWSVRATVNDARTGTNVAVTQGVGVRVPKTDAADFCT